MSRKNLPGKDFSWPIDLGTIPLGSTLSFGGIPAIIGTGGMACKRCGIATNPVNFINLQKMIRANWNNLPDPMDDSIKIKFAFNGGGQKIQSIGAQFAVDNTIDGSPFTAQIRVLDNLAKSHTFSAPGLTIITKLNGSAIFLGAESDLGEAITLAEFTVIPDSSAPIKGFYINNLRIQIN